MSSARVVDDEEERPESYVLFGFLYFSNFFCRFHSDSVALHSTTKVVASDEAKSAKVIIVVGSEPPQSGHCRFGRHKFELQVVCVLISMALALHARHLVVHSHRVMTYGVDGRDGKQRVAAEGREPGREDKKRAPVYKKTKLTHGK